MVALGSDVHNVGKEYGEYTRAMSLLSERGERLQNCMREIIKEAKVYDSGVAAYVSGNK